MKEGKSKAQLPGSELEEIPEAECLELLGRNTLGRFAFVAERRQEIFPVTYGLKAGTVVFRTAPGTKLAHAPGTESAFEIDEYDAETGVGWSVGVHGTAYDVTEGRIASLFLVVLGAQDDKQVNLIRSLFREHLVYDSKGFRLTKRNPGTRVAYEDA